MAKAKEAKLVTTDYGDSTPNSSHCSLHKLYKGMRRPGQNCWACWIVYLRKQGWKVELTKESLDAALSRDSKTKA